MSAQEPDPPSGADPTEHRPFSERHHVRWLTRVGLALLVGLAAGLASAAFLVAMKWATKAFATHPDLLWALPLAGFAVGLAYHYGGRGSHAGNNVILDEIHEPQAWIPRRMAGLVFAGTVITHLFGGSAGREGTAIQMAGSLADGLARKLGITGVERRILLVASIGAGFAAVFGVPLAGFAFALEVQSLGKLRRAAILPALVAAYVGDLTVRAVGVHHDPVPSIGSVELSASLLVKVAVAGIAFGVMSMVFAELLHRTKALSARLFAWPPARPILGGALVIALTGLVGNRDYLGLSLPLIELSLLGGAGVALGAFAWKAIFTVVTLGTGFYGGEVTPLFVIGATLGATMGHVLDAPIPLMAAAGLVGVFAGASNTPIASTILGFELFGIEPTLVLALSCLVSYAVSGSGGIYTSQRRRRWGFGPQDPALA